MVATAHNAILCDNEKEQTLAACNRIYESHIKDIREVPEWAEPWRKTGQRGLLIASSKRLKKNSDRAITPAVEPACVPEHSALPGYPQVKQLRHLHAQLSLGQSCHRQKKSLFMRAGSLRPCPSLCNPVDCGLPGFSVREGVLQARTLECIGQYWLPCPSRALYFLLP